MCFVMSNGGSRAEPAVLEARGIGRRFGHNPPLVVLGGLDLTVEGGQSVAVLGESGVGKSTLLHVLAAIDPADEGDVLVEGRSLSEMTGSELAHMRSRSIGLIFQFHNLLGDFDAVENVMLPLLVGGQGRAVARRRALEALDQVGLSERMSHRPGQLSGGEQQRVAVARAVVGRPRLLLADEPTGNLDPASAARVHELLLEVQAELACALVVATHSTALAGLMQRSLRLAGGRLSEEASA